MSVHVKTWSNNTVTCIFENTHTQTFQPLALNQVLIKCDMQWMHNAMVTISVIFSFFVIGVDVNQPLLEAYKHILLQTIWEMSYVNYVRCHSYVTAVASALWWQKNSGTLWRKTGKIYGIRKQILLVPLLCFRIRMQNLHFYRISSSKTPFEAKRRHYVCELLNRQTILLKPTAITLLLKHEFDVNNRPT